MRRVVLMALSLALAVTGCTKKAQVVINSASDLEGKIIGCQVGTTGEIYAKNEVNAKSVKSFKTGIDAALALKNGAIDAIVLDELPSKEIIKRNADLMLVNDSFASEEYAIAVKKGNSELLSSINKTIQDLKMDGTYEKLVEAFMPVDGKIMIPDVDLVDTHDIVKMGTNAAFPPFEYYEGTEPVGFDVSMSRYIAKDLGKKLQVVDMDFDALIASLQAGSVDFVAAGMTATDERRQNVDFSEPYYRTNQVIIVRK